MLLGGTTTNDLNFKITSDGLVPLLLAVAKCDLAFINLMLRNINLDTSVCDKNGMNAFLVAAYHGKTTIMRRLLMATARDKRQYTPEELQWIEYFALGRPVRSFKTVRT